jgi:hypothetical protein
MNLAIFEDFSHNTKSGRKRWRRAVKLIEGAVLFAPKRAIFTPLSARHGAEDALIPSPL